MIEINSAVLIYGKSKRIVRTNVTLDIYPLERRPISPTLEIYQSNNRSTSCQYFPNMIPHPVGVLAPMTEEASLKVPTAGQTISCPFVRKYKGRLSNVPVYLKAHTYGAQVRVAR